jgi:hypothetical protein
MREEHTENREILGESERKEIGQLRRVFIVSASNKTTGTCSDDALSACKLALFINKNVDDRPHTVRHSLCVV